MVRVSVTSLILNLQNLLIPFHYQLEIPYHPIKKKLPITLMVSSHLLQTHSDLNYLNLTITYQGFSKIEIRIFIFLRPTTPEEITKIIGNFSDTKSSGPNSIPVRILKLLNPEISKTISTLINRSFEMGVFPSVLKISKVIPVFKNKGSPLEVSNYRPISLLSNFEKIYEKTMYSRLMNFLTTLNQIYSKQFGFRKKTLHS